MSDSTSIEKNGTDILVKVFEGVKEVATLDSSKDNINYVVFKSEGKYKLVFSNNGPMYMDFIVDVSTFSRSSGTLSKKPQQLIHVKTFSEASIDLPVVGGDVCIRKVVINTDRPLPVRETITIEGRTSKKDMNQLMGGLFS